MIVTQTPSSLRRPGAFSEFKFLQAGQQLIPLPLRVVVVAEQSAAATADVEVPIQIFDEDDADTKLGKGSFAALMCRKALEQGKLSAAMPELWACPVAESAGVKAVQTITVTVTTALAGDVVLRIAGRTIVASVSAGDSVSTIATAISNAIAAMKHLLPVTASPAAGVVTCTNTTKGVNGNDVAYSLVSAPSGVTIAFAQTVPGTSACSITNALNALYDRRYHAVAIANHTSTDVTAMLTARADAWSTNQKNWRFFFVGVIGSLGTAQTLATAANDFGILFANCEQSPSLPGELAIATAIAEFSHEAPNANLDGQRLALYPPSGAYAFTSAEVESALSGGVTPLTPDGSFVKIERLVTSQVTLNSVPTETVRDIAYPRTAAFRAEQVEVAFRGRFVQEVLTPEVLTRVRDMIVELDRAMEALTYLRDVDSFLDQIQVEQSIQVAGRIVASAPFRVAGPLHQGVFVHTMYL